MICIWVIDIWIYLSIKQGGIGIPPESQFTRENYDYNRCIWMMQFPNKINKVAVDAQAYSVGILHSGSWIENPA